MTVLVVPSLDEKPWPTLGPQVCAFIEEHLTFGPGDLLGQPAVLDDEKRGLICRAYEVYPKGHRMAGRRRFKRVAFSLRKGSAKTELAAWLAIAELHPDGPVRCVGWDKRGQPIGGGVTDPYIPMVAYTEEQSEDLAYGAMLAILGSEGCDIGGDFDLGLERVMRADGHGKAVALASAPNSRDGARTTFQHFDEPLALDTPVPTPEGWSTIGAIEPGDMVIGRDGKPAAVLGVSPVHEGRPCYRVVFADGTAVVTDGAHRWSAMDRRHHQRGARPVTTEEMAAEVVVGDWAGRAPFRWAVPLAQPLELPAAELPVEPYTLGVWLGDGDSRGPVVSQGESDMPALVEALAAVGTVTTAVADSQGNAPRVYLRGIRPALRRARLLGAKAIPSVYLRGSLTQRLQLLRGLMDTDGHATVGGWCTFVSNSRDFAEQVAELVRTLGYRPTVLHRADSRSRTGEMVKVSFQARPDMVPFTFKRKAARCQRASATRAGWRSVVAVESVASVPVRCIAVDNDDHLFLVGRGMAVTHNTHHMSRPILKKAHRAMLANIPKRRLADAWSLETTTAPAPGEHSVAEDTMEYAQAVADGQVKDSNLFFFHRQAGDEHNLKTKRGRRAAIVEASGPVAKWSDVDSILAQWDDPTADLAYLERVWLNRLVRASGRAFDMALWDSRARKDYTIPDGALVTLGFDGARHHDSTGIVATEVATGFQQKLGVWEKPFKVAGPDGEEQPWEVPVSEVRACMSDAFDRFNVWRLYADPPYWESVVDEWAGEFGEQRVVAWLTNRWLKMAEAVRGFANAIADGTLSHDGDADMARHIGNAHRKNVYGKDVDGKPRWVIYKDSPNSPRKVDLAVSAVLSWEARGDALRGGAGKEDSEEFYDDGGRGITAIGWEGASVEDA